ncbi:MAG: AAA family ATPase [Dehalococcoidia bacterium]
MPKKIRSSKSYSNQGRYANFDLDGYQPLPVAYQLRGTILERIRAGKPVLTDIDGREETKGDVIRALLSGAHPYLVSEEGTGKTRLARSLTKLLPPIPVIKGCPYNDDPKWPAHLLCPRCRASHNPLKEFGFELVPGERRFSRIQGNEYTNEAKLLGLKDIQAIAQGMSPSDPQVFTGTGVFRANRGILFVDELPAIRTKIQVLLHPILEEKKAILEEYNWEHPLDVILVATGNPQGFSHVNEIPRPLLDRLEPIYMALPEEEVEKEIMLKERFQVSLDSHSVDEAWLDYPSVEDIERRVVAPWWILDIINKAVRYSRICPHVEKRASVRATNRAIDHSHASAEVENREVVNLRHVCYGLRLALRGRIGLRVDLVDFENAEKTFRVGDQLAEDFLWNVFEDMRKERAIVGDSDRDKLASELGQLFSSDIDLASERLPGSLLGSYGEVKKIIGSMKASAPQQVREELLSPREKAMYRHPQGKVGEEYNFSALETLVNMAVHEGIINESEPRGIFVPQQFKM